MEIEASRTKSCITPFSSFWKKSGRLFLYSILDAHSISVTVGKRKQKLLPQGAVKTKAIHLPTCEISVFSKRWGETTTTKPQKTQIRTDLAQPTRKEFSPKPPCNMNVYSSVNPSPYSCPCKCQDPIFPAIQTLETLLQCG